MKIALGLRVKTGWAAVVLLERSGKVTRLLDSREIRLSDWDLPHGRQPYHATFGIEQTDRAIIARLVRAAEQYSRKALRALLREYEKTGHHVRRAAIVVSSLTDPASIANQHMRAHASEGQLYRLVVERGLALAGVKAMVVLERDAYVRLAQAQRRSSAAVKRAVAALGETATPWRADEKLAAAAAWLTLPPRASRA